MEFLNHITTAQNILDGGIMVSAETEGIGFKDAKGRSVLALLYQFLNPDATGHSIDRVTLMKMMTTWPSYYVLAEGRLGSLAQGKLADFLVLNKDYFTDPQKEIPTVYPVVTVLGGKVRIVWQEAASSLGRWVRSFGSLLIRPIKQ